MSGRMIGPLTITAIVTATATGALTMTVAVPCPPHSHYVMPRQR